MDRTLEGQRCPPSSHTTQDRLENIYLILPRGLDYKLGPWLRRNVSLNREPRDFDMSAVT